MGKVQRGDEIVKRLSMLAHTVYDEIGLIDIRDLGENTVSLTVRLAMDAEYPGEYGRSLRSSSKDSSLSPWVNALCGLESTASYGISIRPRPDRTCLMVKWKNSSSLSNTQFYSCRRHCRTDKRGRRVGFKRNSC